MQNHSLFRLRSDYSRGAESRQSGQRHAAQMLSARTPAQFRFCKPYLGGVILTVVPQDSQKAAAFFSWLTIWVIFKKIFPDISSCHTFLCRIKKYFVPRTFSLWTYLNSMIKLLSNLPFDKLIRLISRSLSPRGIFFKPGNMPRTFRQSKHSPRGRGILCVSQTGWRPSRRLRNIFVPRRGSG